MKTILHFIFIFLSLGNYGSETANIAKSPLSRQTSAPMRVLFIGNSHTYYNGGIATQLIRFLQHADLPAMPVVEQVAMDGYTLDDHAKDPDTRAKLLDQNWDVVVFQENTSRAATDISLAKAGFINLNSRVHSPHTRRCLFMTWPYATIPQMMGKLKKTYEEAAPMINATVIPVGLAFTYCINDPDKHVVLYDADGIHPSPAGTFLAAAMFYMALYGLDPTQNTYNGSLTKSEAAYLKLTAKKIIQAYAD